MASLLQPLAWQSFSMEQMATTTVQTVGTDAMCASLCKLKRYVQLSAQYCLFIWRICGQPVWSGAFKCISFGIWQHNLLYKVAFRSAYYCLKCILSSPEIHTSLSFLVHAFSFVSNENGRLHIFSSSQYKGQHRNCWCSTRQLHSIKSCLVMKFFNLCIQWYLRFQCEPRLLL